ncbi:MAG TPA: hypothetical protein VMT63_10630 [Bacteroidales bacterium]|nr:hypothetical protein [Bacteroidales bacterium]
MQKAYFNPEGEPLKMQVVYKNGVIDAVYNITLSEKESNSVVEDFDGNNLNPEDDVYALPGPVVDNDGRLIILTNKFYGLDLEKSNKYEIALEIFQGGTLISTNTDSGSITGNAQNSLLITKLLKQP